MHVSVQRPGLPLIVLRLTAEAAESADCHRCYTQVLFEITVEGISLTSSTEKDRCLKGTRQFESRAYPGVTWVKWLNFTSCWCTSCYFLDWLTETASFGMHVTAAEHFGHLTGWHHAKPRLIGP